jgi:hypothetical protein
MAKKHRSVSAAQKAGSLYFYDKNGTKKLAVTAEQLNAWKKKNKGKYKGSALTAWANNKGKDVGEKGPAKVRPQLRPKEKTSVPFKEAARDKTTTDRSRPKGQGADPFGSKTKKDKPGAHKSDNTSSSSATRGNKDKSGPKAEQKRRADRKSRMPDELSNAPMNSSKGRTMSDLKAEAMYRNAEFDIYLGSDDDKFGDKKDRRVTGVRPPSQAQKAFSTSLRDAKMNKGGMTKKKVMTYNIGGMVKSQVNNLKKGRS